MIGIFRTNIATHEDRQHMISAIQANFEVGTCYVDLEDCDKVLRITEMKVDEYTMIDFVQQQGFLCEILD
ncbi:hypothetical protein [Chitinophaga japonensis]|nr:hypothetical protein [Chitinophaga japonensis]